MQVQKDSAKMPFWNPLHGRMNYAFDLSSSVLQSLVVIALCAACLDDSSLCVGDKTHSTVSDAIRSGPGTDS